MDDALLSLTHEQQQQAVEQIQQLMQQGMSSGEAIATVANALRLSLREKRQPPLRNGKFGGVTDID